MTTSRTLREGDTSPRRTRRGHCSGWGREAQTAAGAWIVNKSCRVRGGAAASLARSVIRAHLKVCATRGVPEERRALGGQVQGATSHHARRTECTGTTPLGNPASCAVRRVPCRVRGGAAASLARCGFHAHLKVCATRGVPEERRAL